MDVTRRTLARMLAVTAAVPALASPETAIAQSATPGGADSDLTAAREMLRANAQKLAQVHLPMSTEPAFRFKA